MTCAAVARTDYARIGAPRADHRARTSARNSGISQWPTIEAAEDTLLTLTADIVAAHVSNNSVAVNDLPNLIQNVHRRLERHFRAVCRARAEARAEGLDPLVGQAGLHRLPRRREEAEDAEAASDDPLQYDARPISPEVGPFPDYPMVAPNYAEQRRTLAKSIGLGTKRKRARRASAAERRITAIGMPLPRGCDVRCALTPPSAMLTLPP